MRYVRSPQAALWSRASTTFASAELPGTAIEPIAKSAKQLVCDRKPYVIEMDDGSRVPARTIIIATGAEYRRPSLKNFSQFESGGVYYAATFIEAQLCRDEEVIVVG